MFSYACFVMPLLIWTPVQNGWFQKCCSVAIKTVALLFRWFCVVVLLYEVVVGIQLCTIFVLLYEAVDVQVDLLFGCFVKLMLLLLRMLCCCAA